MTQPQQCLICRGVGKHKPIRNLSGHLVGCPLDTSGDSALQCEDAKLRVERELELDRIGKAFQEYITERERRATEDAKWQGESR